MARLWIMMKDEITIEDRKILIVCVLSCHGSSKFDVAPDFALSHHYTPRAESTSRTSISLASMVLCSRERAFKSSIRWQSAQIRARFLRPGNGVVVGLHKRHRRAQSHACVSMIVSDGTLQTQDSISVRKQFHSLIDHSKIPREGPRIASRSRRLISLTAALMLCISGFSSVICF